MRWQLYDKRLELLKAIKHQHSVYDKRQEQHVIGEIVNCCSFDSIKRSFLQGLQRICNRSSCRAPLPENAQTCPQCNSTSKMPACTICRLPVKGMQTCLCMGNKLTCLSLKGLSRTCVTCSHVTHISCWNSFGVVVPICPSGCGCFCTGAEPLTRPSTRLGLTPPPSTLLLAADTS